MIHLHFLPVSAIASIVISMGVLFFPLLTEASQGSVLASIVLVSMSLFLLVGILYAGREGALFDSKR